MSDKELGDRQGETRRHSATEETAEEIIIAELPAARQSLSWREWGERAGVSSLLILSLLLSLFGSLVYYEPSQNEAEHFLEEVDPDTNQGTWVGRSVGVAGVINPTPGVWVALVNVAAGFMFGSWSRRALLLFCTVMGLFPEGPNWFENVRDGTSLLGMPPLLTSTILSLLNTTSMTFASEALLRSFWNLFKPMTARHTKATAQLAEQVARENNASVKEVYKAAGMGAEALTATLAKVAYLLEKPDKNISEKKTLMALFNKVQTVLEIGTKDVESGRTFNSKDAQLLYCLLSFAAKNERGVPLQKHSIRTTLKKFLNPSLLVLMTSLYSRIGYIALPYLQFDKVFQGIPYDAEISIGFTIVAGACAVGFSVVGVNTLKQFFKDFELKWNGHRPRIFQAHPWFSWGVSGLVLLTGMVAGGSPASEAQRATFAATDMSDSWRPVLTFLANQSAAWLVAIPLGILALDHGKYWAEKLDDKQTQVILRLFRKLDEYCKQYESMSFDKRINHLRELVQQEGDVLKNVLVDLVPESKPDEGTHLLSAQPATLWQQLLEPPTNSPQSVEQDGARIDLTT